MKIQYLMIMDKCKLSNFIFLKINNKRNKKTENKG